GVRQAAVPAVAGSGLHRQYGFHSESADTQLGQVLVCLSSNPLLLPAERTKNRARFMIFLVWVTSGLWLIPIFSWHRLVNGVHNPGDGMRPEYKESFPLKVVTGFLTSLSIIRHVLSVRPDFSGDQKEDLPAAALDCSDSTAAAASSIVLEPLLPASSAARSEAGEPSAAGQLADGHAQYIYDEMIVDRTTERVQLLLLREPCSRIRGSESCSRCLDSIDQAGASIGVAATVPVEAAPASGTSNGEFSSPLKQPSMKPNENRSSKSRFKLSNSLKRRLKRPRQLGVIMGAFTACFCPTLSSSIVVVAFCPDCVSSELMLALTWFMSYQLSKSAGMATSSSDFHLPSIRQGGGSQRPSSAASTSSSVSNVHDFRQAVASSQQKPFRSRRAGRAGIAAGRPAAEEAAAASRREARSSSRESARSVHSHFADFLELLTVEETRMASCPSTAYIRVGGGYRHSFWYIKVLLEEIELARHQALIRQKRLETIAEGSECWLLRRPSSLVRKYLSKEDAQNLQGFDKEEQKAIKTVVRTKSGRVIEKIVYVSRDEYDKIQRGEVDANAVLRRRLNLKDGEQEVERPQDAHHHDQDQNKERSDYREEEVLVSDEDYQKLKEGKADLSKVLGKYLSKDEGEVEGWSAPQKEAMKVIKTYVRTKSGKLVEKTILMTEDEFQK
uniref:CRAL-TRIO domain-containing protein n=1 Tax=Macrostomum lignano TaxID=282301 RepID=A0A1I8F7L6_9PLAT